MGKKSIFWISVHWCVEKTWWGFFHLFIWIRLWCFTWRYASNCEPRTASVLFVSKSITRSTSFYWFCKYLKCKVLMLLLLCKLEIIRRGILCNVTTTPWPFSLLKSIDIHLSSTAYSKHSIYFSLANKLLCGMSVLLTDIGISKHLVRGWILAAN